MSANNRSQGTARLEGWLCQRLEYLPTPHFSIEIQHSHGKVLNIYQFLSISTDDLILTGEAR